MIQYTRGRRIIFRVLAMLLIVTPHCLNAQNRNGNGFVVAGTRPPEEPVVIGKALEHREGFGKNQQQAFAGQTRVGAVVTKSSYKVSVVCSSLYRPWGLAFLPDGRLLITEKRGSLRIVTQSGIVGDSIRGLPRDILFGGDAGLLDIAIDPSFKTNRKIYFCYAQRREGGSGLVICSAVLPEDELWLKEVTAIYKIGNTSRSMAHYGARLLFDKHGKLFVSTSERMFEDTRIQAQWLSSPLGKILRINTDGTPAEGNPIFKDSTAALKEVYAYGIRNPQGLCFDLNGNLWDTEHGQQGGDEINLIQPGKNYGWPIIAYGEEYTGGPILQGLTAKAGMEQPVYYWNPAVAPSGACFYSGKQIPEWKGNMFIACLAGQHIIRLVIKDNRVLGEERLLLDQHQRIRAVAEGPDGALWAITDAENGRLIRISKN